MRSNPPKIKLSPYNSIFIYNSEKDWWEGWKLAAHITDSEYRGAIPAEIMDKLNWSDLEWPTGP